MRVYRYMCIGLEGQEAHPIQNNECKEQQYQDSTHMLVKPLPPRSHEGVREEPTARQVMFQFL